MPLSTTNLHIKALENAGLIRAEHKPATRGSQKLCTRAFDTILLHFPHDPTGPENVLELTMPLGAYVDCRVTPTCGLASETGIIGLFDDPASFYEPERSNAQLIWFHSGYLEYRFPHRLPVDTVVESVQLGLELCSEAPLHHDAWPSDVTVWINGVETATWTSPADFGGQRGKLTPAWWESQNSQYGLLKVWRVDGRGSWVDGLRLSNVRIDDVSINSGSVVSVRIGVKDDAQHVGGINLFGQRFGNYPQDLIVRVGYR